MSARDLFRVVDLAAEPAREAIVLVHGSWTDHATWQFVHPLIAADHVVVTYDRRGHSRSGPVDGHGSRRVHEDDLIEIVERLDRGAVHLVGNSYGGSIVLGVAARRPDLVRSVTGHEPPLVGVVDPSAVPTGSLAVTLADVLAVTADVERAVRAGDVEAGARRFVEDLALGPGMWDVLPADVRAVMVGNAPSFLEMLEDPDWGAVPVVDDSVPLLLTTGDASPAWFALTAEAVARRHPHAERQLVAGAGHVPHLTHPAEYATVVRAFVDRASTTTAGAGRGA